MIKPHIVILGAGFGGTYVGKALSGLCRRGEIDLTVVNRTNYFLFTPLLHEVATGSLSPGSVAEPLREIWRNDKVRIVQGNVEAIDAANHRVEIRGIGRGAPRISLAYDYLVIATGAETCHYGIPGAEQFSMPLKTLADAARIRSKIIDSFEEAILSPDPAERLRKISFAVVGGGPTGVEVAAELADFIREIVSRYYHDTDCSPGEPLDCAPEEPTIGIIDGATELLMQFSPTMRTVAMDRLKKSGVNMHLGSKVIEVTPHGVILENKVTVPADTVIWAAGVTPVIPPFKGDMPETVKGRLSVDEYMRLRGDQKIFVLGDAAASADPAPMLAQAAVQQARTVARNIRAAISEGSMRPFAYRSKGALVSVGQWFAIGEIFSMKLYGKFAWWLWRTVYLFKFASNKKRLKIALEWTYNIFMPRDITKLS